MALTQEQARQALGSLLCAATAAGLPDAEDIVGDLLVGVARGDVQSGPAEHASLEIADGILTAAYGVVAMLSHERGACAWHVLPLGGEDTCVICGAPTRWCSRCSACLALQEQITQCLASGGLTPLDVERYLVRRAYQEHAPASDASSTLWRPIQAWPWAPGPVLRRDVMDDCLGRGEIEALQRGRFLRRGP